MQNYGGYNGGYFFNPIRRNLSMVKGDTMSFGFQIQGLKGEEPSSIQLTCKETLEDTTPLFTVSLNDTIDKRTYDAEHDIYTYGVRIPPRLTIGLNAGRYFYDLELQDNGDTITLMIGRISIEDDVTKSLIPPEPSYENGDNIPYPTDEEPTEEDVKLYGELKIYEIAESIQDITGSSDKMTTAQMIAALLGVKSELDDIETALRSVTGSSEDFPLDEIASQISELVDFETMLRVNIKSLKAGYGWADTSLAAWVYYPDDDHFFIFPSNGELGLKLRFKGDRDTGVYADYFETINTSNLGRGNNQQTTTTGITVTGCAKKEEIEDSRYLPSNSSNWGVNISDLVTANHPLYKKESQIFNIYSGSHPVTLRNWGNNQKAIMENAFKNISFLDLFTVISAPSGFDLNTITKGIILFGGGNITSTVLACGDDNFSDIYVDGNGVLNSSSSSYFSSGVNNFSGTTAAKFNITLSTASGKVSYADGGGNNLVKGLVFSTYDLKDLNDNVIYPANMTIEEFKSLFNL